MEERRGKGRDIKCMMGINLPRYTEWSKKSKPLSRVIKSH